MRNPKSSREGKPSCGCWSTDALGTRAGVWQLTNTALPKAPGTATWVGLGTYSCVTELEALQRVKGRSQVNKNVKFASLIAPRNLLSSIMGVKIQYCEAKHDWRQTFCLVGNWWSVMNVVFKGFPYEWFLFVPVFGLISRTCFPPPITF